MHALVDIIVLDGGTFLPKRLYFVPNLPMMTWDRILSFKLTYQIDIISAYGRSESVKRAKFSKIGGFERLE